MVKREGPSITRTREQMGQAETLFKEAGKGGDSIKLQLAEA